MPLSRRNFLKSIPVLTLLRARSPYAAAGNIITVNGRISSGDLGLTLIHEHILVDFVGATNISYDRWDRDKVVDAILPLLKEIKDAGIQSFVDCTPAFLGRDIALLKKLSVLSGLHIITNTGYYGGSDHRFLPPQVFEETSVQLGDRWIREFREGIEGTDVRPGFMKISVNPGPLSDISEKLIEAAAFTHSKTGLTIASHTGPAIPALQQIEILKSNRVHPSAFIWVHAQNESDWRTYVQAANEGAWISLDGVNDDNVEDYVSRLLWLRQQDVLQSVLISHDAGWFDPAKENGGNIRGYMTISTKLIPRLREKGMPDEDIRTLMKTNPARAFAIGIKRWKKQSSKNK